MFKALQDVTADETPQSIIFFVNPDQLSARAYVRKIIGGNLMRFAMPMALFGKMEGNVAGSFLERGVWNTLMAST